MPNMVKIGLGVGAGPIPSWSPHLGYPFFVFFARRPEETPRPIATLNGSYDAVSAKEVPIGVTYGEYGVRVPPTFWSGGNRTPTFWEYDRKITATFPHPALT